MPDRERDAVLAISDTIRNDLAHLAGYADRLAQIARVIAQSHPGAESVPGAELANTVGASVGSSSDDARHLLFTIWNLYHLQKSMHVSAAKLIDEVTASLETRAPDPWKAEHLGAWRKAHDEIVSLLDTMTDEHPLVVSGKAATLGQEHQNLLVEARIVTDVRPVFNSAANRVLESLIIHTLLLGYFDGVKTRRIEFALDASDVANLRRLCDRAERKATVLRAALKDLPWNTTVLGEESSD